MNMKRFAALIALLPALTLLFSACGALLPDVPGRSASTTATAGYPAYTSSYVPQTTAAVSPTGSAPSVPSSPASPVAAAPSAVSAAALSENVYLFTAPETHVDHLSGLVTVPYGFDRNAESLPVIVFLHGAGERGSGSPETVNAVTTYGIAKYFTEDPEYQGVRAITVSPQCPENTVWDNITYELMDYIEQAVTYFNGDRSRISITGISMGGFGTWNMIMTFPDYFSCAAPICGGGMAWRVDQRLAGFPIRAFHSTDDPVVDYDNSEEMVSAASAYGADVSLTTYTDTGHASWGPAYEDTDLVIWLTENTK